MPEQPYLGEEERRILTELNKVRTDPRRYAEQVVRPLFDFFDGRLLKLPGWRPLLTKEGIAPAKELYTVLLDMDAVGTVSPAEGLCYAAIDHVEDQAEGKVGHIGTDGSLPKDRVARYGKSRLTTEAIAYGDRYGGLVLLQLLIDDGVESRGHRKVLLDGRFNRAGVALGPHAVFGRMGGIVLADRFNPGR